MHENCKCTHNAKLQIKLFREETIMLLDVVLDTLLDSLRLLPFLFLTYLLMEFLEHRAGEAGRSRIGAARKSGPVWGALFGIIPQCGFSAAASSLYSGRMITMGTLMAIYLSTSDEMLPILISSAVSLPRILRILTVKAGIAMITGLLVDLIMKDPREHQPDSHRHHHDHEKEEDCQKHLTVAALHHTLEVFFYIILISFVLNLIIALVGEETLAMIFTELPVVGEMLAALVGLIPNCASSVVITELYLSGVITSGSMMAGLLVNAGVGILVLLRLDHDKKDILRIVGTLYVSGVLWGLAIELLQVVF